MSKQDTTSAVVAPGRTIHGTKSGGRPGGRLVGTPREIERLRAAGYLVDPKRVPVPSAGRRDTWIIPKR